MRTHSPAHRVTGSEHEPPPAETVDNDALLIQLLGGFAVIATGGAVDSRAWRLQKARSLVKLLALAPRHRLLREQVLDEFWPEFDPDAAANNLYQALHAARRALSTVGVTNAIRVEQGLIVLDLSNLQVDVDEFESAAAAARQTLEPAALRAAVALYRGELLPEDRYEDWAAARRESLRQTYIRLLLDLARTEEEAGNPAAAIEVLREVVAHEPTHDVANTDLMRLYAANGQRQQAIRQYEQLAETLRRDLEIEPDEDMTALYKRIRTGDLARPAPIVAPAGLRRRHNIPADLTTFIGREAETAAIRDYLIGNRLVTLVGAAGAGKTRLSLHVARGLTDAFPDGAWLVDLAAVTGDGFVASAIARVLNLTETGDRPLRQTWIDALAEARLLLLLDNCEHVIGECASLAESLLHGSPGLHILATSREPLGVPGEVTVGISPLPFPTDMAVPEPMAIESVRLLVDRIRYRQPGFTLTPDLIPGAAEICRRLEGLPLAIELAAARAGTLSLPQIAARLSDALPLLTAGGRNASPRQRTLRGALDWSYRLLSSAERRVFPRLASFAGGWTLEAAAAVAGDTGTPEDETLDILSFLVDRSLVIAEPHAEGMRYRLLEPIRQYAAGLLQESGEAGAIHARHAEYFTGLAEHARPLLDGPEQSVWLARLESEHDNLRASLRWARDSGADDLALRLVAALWLFWYTRGHLQEGESWLRSVLEHSGGTTPTRAAAIRGLGALLYKQRHYEEARASFERALDLYRLLDDRAEIANCLSNIAMVYTDEGEIERALPLHEEVLSVRRKMGNDLGMASTLTNLAVLHYTRGDYACARDLQEESLELQRNLGDLGSVAISLNNLGELSLLLGDIDRAESAFAEALALGHQLGEMEVIASCFDGLASIALARSDLERAVRLHGASDELRRVIGSPIRPQEELSYAATWERVCGELGPSIFTRIEADGAAMPIERAVSYALAHD